MTARPRFSKPMRGSSPPACLIHPLFKCLILLTLIAAPPARAAEDSLLVAAAPGAELTGVSLHVLTYDARTGRPQVWIDRGREHGLGRGNAFLALMDGNPVGVLTLDTILSQAAAGEFDPEPGFSMPGEEISVTLSPVSAASGDFMLAQAFQGPVQAGIALPRKHSNPFNAPWLAEYDSSLNATFRAIAESGAAPEAAIPPPPVAGASQTAPILIPELNTAPSSNQYRIRALDPDMAADIKSSFFIEPGDCLHIAPWPGIDTGYFTVVDDDEAFLLPDDGMANTSGKTIARLEKELRNMTIFQALQSPVQITPCVKTSKINNPDQIK